MSRHVCCRFDWSSGLIVYQTGVFFRQTTPPLALMSSITAWKSAFWAAADGTFSELLAAGPAMSTSSIATRTSLSVMPWSEPGGDTHLPPAAAAPLEPVDAEPVA